MKINAKVTKTLETILKTTSYTIKSLEDWQDTVLTYQNNTPERTRIFKRALH